MWLYKILITFHFKLFYIAIRYKQHYEKLLKEKPNNWEILPLEDMLYYEQPTRYIVENTKYSDKYPIPVLTAGKSFILGYTNERFGIFNNLPCIIFDDFTTESKYVDFPFKVKSSAMKILKCNTNVNNKFIYYSMQLIECSTDTHKRFWISIYSKKNIYLPPLTEQQRIVAKIEELFAQVDKIEEEKQSLLKLIDMTKEKVLDLAMKGKLVEQDPNDEPASVLLEKIFEEKKKLAKEGKIKLSKDELLPPKISDDNDYYQDLPCNWEKSKLKNITTIISKGTTPKDKNSYGNFGVGFLRIENLNDDFTISKNEMKFITKETNDTLLKRSILLKNDIVISIAGTLGKMALIKDSDLPLNTSQAISFVRLIDSNLINTMFIIYFIQSSIIKERLLQQAKVTAIPNLTLEMLSNIIICLPPLNEQKRIVVKIEDIFTKLEELKDSL